MPSKTPPRVMTIAGHRLGRWRGHTGRDEGGVPAVALGQLEAEHAAIEAQRPLEVGHLQVDMADAGAGVDRAGHGRIGMLLNGPAAPRGRSGSGCPATARGAVWSARSSPVLGMDQHVERVPVEHQPRHDPRELLGREQHLVHAAGMRADRLVVPAAEPGREPRARALPHRVRRSARVSGW